MTRAPAGRAWWVTVAALAAATVAVVATTDALHGAILAGWLLLAAVACHGAREQGRADIRAALARHPTGRHRAPANHREDQP